MTLSSKILLVLGTVGALAAVVFFSLLGRAPAPPSEPAPQTALPVRPTIVPIAPKAEGFSGRWAGPCSLAVRCGNEPPSVDEDQLEITIAQVGAGLEVERGGCRYAFDLRRRTATLRAAAPCEAARDQGEVESWTLTLGTGEAEWTSNLVSRVEGSPGVRCTTRLNGTLSRR